MNMKSSRRIAFIAALLAVNTAAQAQFPWANECIDPANTTPRTPDYNFEFIGNGLLTVLLGRSGAVTYGGTAGPCYGGAFSAEAAGRFAFSVGNLGSTQSTFDDNMSLTPNFPDVGGDYSYASIVTNNGSVLFGDGNTLDLLTIPLGKREIQAAFTASNNVRANLVLQVIGDAAKFTWRLTNTGESQRVGLRFANYVGLRSNETDISGNNQAGSLLGTRSGVAKDVDNYVALITVPSGRPVRTERNYLRNSINFPSAVNVEFGQSFPYGMRFENTSSGSFPDHTQVDQFQIGNYGGRAGLTNSLAGIIQGNTIRPRTATDTSPDQRDPLLFPGIAVEESNLNKINEVCVVQGFAPITLAQNATRTIVHYVKSPWGIGNYGISPAAAFVPVVDAPRLIESSPGSTGDLNPNPFTISVTVDNQYNLLDQELIMRNTEVVLELDPESGLSLANGDVASKTISAINPNQLGLADFDVQADGNLPGEKSFTIRVRSGGASKVFTGKILIAATPRLRIPEGASLITIPWGFANSSLDAIFADAGNPMQFGVDYVAYRWDPGTGTYLPATSAVRGQSLWIVTNNDFDFRNLVGAQSPTDTATGTTNVTTLRPGWNMIGNPYTFPVPISQLVGFSRVDQQNTFTWNQMVAKGWVSPALAKWTRNPDDPTTGRYEYTSSSTSLMEPQTGYWVYNTITDSIDINWPPVFLAGISGSTRAQAGDSERWTQSDKQWKLQLTARTQTGIDANNFIGVVKTAADVQKFSVRKPPVAPKQAVELAITESVLGQPTRMASSFTDRTGRKSWDVVAKVLEPGEVTLTWPNINTIPRNVRMTVKDKATNEVRDLRFNSGYTFNMEEVGNREFTLTMEPAGAAKALIGNVTIARPGRDVNGPITINYTLSTDAVTTVRILGTTGKEVFAVQRGRSANSGENSATWALRDNSNRAVAPGAYQVEILAESANGERVRKIVPVTVLR